MSGEAERLEKSIWSMRDWFSRNHPGSWGDVENVLSAALAYSVTLRPKTEEDRGKAITEREALKQAIEWARSYSWHNSAMRPHLLGLADAAEKYLAFLPAPVWKVRVWWGAGDGKAQDSGPELFLKDTHEDAFAGASAAVMAGAIKVEVEKP